MDRPTKQAVYNTGTTIPEQRAIDSVQLQELVVAIMLNRAADRRVLTQSLQQACIELDASTLVESDFDLGIVDLQTLLRLELEIRAARKQAFPALRPILLAASEPELKKANTFLGDLAEDVIRTPIRRIELSSRVSNLLRLRQLSCDQKLETENTQSKLQGATRALHAFSSCNERVIHASSEQGMLTDICESLVKDGGYSLAWIGQASENANDGIELLAAAGQASKAVSQLYNSLEDNPLGQGPVSLTFITGRWHQVSDISTRPELSAWKQLADAHQLHSIIVFPLAIRGDVPEACLTIYSSDIVGIDDAAKIVAHLNFENRPKLSSRYPSRSVGS